MTPRLYLAYLLREGRGQRWRLGFFIACLAVGVAAVTAVAVLAASLDGAIRRDARQLLAADLAVTGREPLPEALRQAIAALPGAATAEVREMVTIVAAPPRGEQPGPSRLVELKAVAPGYPFYGLLRLEPDRPLAELLAADGAVAAPELLAALGLEVGSELRVGGAAFRVRGEVLSEPDRVGGSFSLGPRLFLSVAGLERAGLVRRGSRVRYRTLVKLPGDLSRERLAAVAAGLEKQAGPGFRVETYAEAQPALRRSLDRAERFLGLVALVSLLAGGIGVAQTVRAWLAGRLDSIAVLKCLGLTPGEVLGLYLGQTALLGLAASLAGVAAGIGVALVVPHLLGDLLPAAAVDPFQPLAAARGLALGIGVALLASLPPLAAVRRVPPARVLRRDAEPLAASRWATAGTAAAVVAGVFLLATAQSGSPDMGARFTAGLALTAGVLAAAAWGLTRLTARLRRAGPRRPLALAHGLAALARPGAATLGAIVALGLGVLVVLAMSLVQQRFSSRLATEFPRNAPSVFLIGIPPDQWPGVRRLLQDAGAERIDSVPVVTARLTAVDGKSTEELASGDKRSRRWAFTREQRLTYLATLPADNRLVEGKLWSDPKAAEVSVEEEFAGELGAHLGSILSFDLQGVPLDLKVTSIRSVDWETFGINFYLVVEPGVLEEAPQQRLAAARLPAGGEQHLQDLVAARFPDVTLLNVREILSRVAAVLERVGFGVRLLGGFTVLAGIAILAGSVSAGAARRGREVALLKTLGTTRFGVAATFAVEYALVGLTAGVIGAVGAGVLAWAVLTRGMDLDWSFAPRPYLVAVAATVALAVGAGLAASFRALARHPVEVLRGE
jgi:putative ABC transport system permease protein